MQNLKQHIINENLQPELLKGKFGLERENVRVTPDGKLSLKPHPKELGDKNDHPYITTDFSESQIEIITPPQDSIEEAIKFLETVHDIVEENIGDEMLWPQSLPPIIPEPAKIPIARYGDKGKEKEAYREILSNIYGKTRQLISGTHFNFSFDDEFIQSLYKSFNSNLDYSEFKNEMYLKVTRNFLRYRWFLVWLSGRTPITHETFQVKSLKSGECVTVKCLKGLSIRMGTSGYRNKEEYYLNFNSLKEFRDSLNLLISEGKLISEKELYYPIRIKSFDNYDTISHLEVRVLDLDPEFKSGISDNLLRFIHLFLVYCLLKDEDDSFDDKVQKVACKNHDIIACCGLCEEINILKGEDKLINSIDWSREFFVEIEKVLSSTEVNLDGNYLESMKYVQKLVENPKKHPARDLIYNIELNGYVDYHLEKAKKYKKESLDKTYRFHGYEDMELSTQLLLKEAVRRGINFDILDRGENFVKLWNRNKEEFVVQATKTSLDNYSSILMMENKIVTKKVLADNNINVPSGKDFNDIEKAKSSFRYFEGRAVVVKPKSTNFGIGITIIKDNNNKEVFDRAVEIAFESEDSVMIEDFFDGREFRIFVIGDEVVGILHRVPANVKGDGRHTIRELIAEKNRNPLRGKGYRTPLEKINTGEAEEMFLNSQGYNFEYIPELDEVVYLRENSNISTGGDSIDFTDDIHQSYKDISVKATKAMGVEITGLDMIIKDITKPATPDNYTIIEMNFNPAIHIHCHPFVGKNRRLNHKIMDVLGF